MKIANRSRGRAVTPVRRACLVRIGVLLLISLGAGCASHSAGHLPLQQETLAARCPVHAVKECVVSGGNKFRKRYEYCGCRESGRR